MNSDEIKTNIKRFFSNKNTVTFLMVIIAIVIVYFAYNYLVNRAVSPVSLPYSETLIKAGTEITNDMVGTVRISGTFVTGSGEGLIQNRGQIVQKYVSKGYQIPAHSFFYREALSSEEEAQKTSFEDMPDGYSPFQLEVDFHSTYGCSIMPGNYIDLYFSAQDDERKVIFDIFIKSIQVLEVVDKDGYDVFTHTDDDEEPKPKYMRFAVPIEYMELLNKALLISSYNIEIVPVPRNAGYSENPGNTEIVNEAIENFILSQTVYFDN